MYLRLISPLISMTGHPLADLVAGDHDRTSWRNFQAPGGPAFEETGSALSTVDVPQEARHGPLLWHIFA